MEQKNRQQRRGGGVAIFIQANIPYEIIKNIPQEIEGLTIKIKTTVKTEITITNLYLPPKEEIDMQIIKPILAINNLICCGDMNAQNKIWGAQHNDARGTKIEEIIEEYHVTVLNAGAGTKLNPDGHYTHPDVAMATGNIALKSEYEVIDNEWGSDHRPMKITINEKPYVNPNSETKLNMKKADWKVYQNNCRATINSDTFNDTNESYENMARKIIEAAEQAMPRTRVGGKSRRKMVPYWNTRCQDAIDDKRRARDKMKRSRDLMDGIRYREAKAKAQRTLREEQRECWRNYCTTLNDQSKTSEVWRISKKMTGRQTNRGIPMIVENNTKYTNNKDKANAIARCLENNSSHANFTPEFQQNRIKAEEKRSLEKLEMEEMNPELNEDFIYHELDACLRHCKKNKSPGEDKIQYEMLQHMPKCSKKVLLAIINKIWQAGQLPKERKHAIV